MNLPAASPFEQNKVINASVSLRIADAKSAPRIHSGYRPAALPKTERQAPLDFPLPFLSSLHIFFTFFERFLGSCHDVTSQNGQ
ncbi:MAG: hypothetical protein P8010_15080 [Desulfosarcinaceae bacterium]